MFVRSLGLGLCLLLVAPTLASAQFAEESTIDGVVEGRKTEYLNYTSSSGINVLFLIVVEFETEKLAESGATEIYEGLLKGYDNEHEYFVNEPKSNTEIGDLVDAYGTTLAESLVGKSDHFLAVAIDGPMVYIMTLVGGRDSVRELNNILVAYFTIPVADRGAQLPTEALPEGMIPQGSVPSTSENRGASS
jgi:hypothetical protein